MCRAGSLIRAKGDDEGATGNDPTILEKVVNTFEKKQHGEWGASKRSSSHVCFIPGLITQNIFQKNTKKLEAVTTP